MPFATTLSIAILDTLDGAAFADDAETNFTAVAGSEARIECRVTDLGNKTVNEYELYTHIQPLKPH